MPYAEQIIIKSVDSQLVAASLGVISNDREGASSVIRTLFENTYEYIISQGVTNLGNAICIYHDIEARNHQNIPIEKIIPLFGKVSSSSN